MQPVVDRRSGRLPVNGWMVRACAAIAIGALIGAATSVGQTYLNLPWLALVNAASPWLLGGFVAGTLQARRNAALAAGLASCILEVIVYFLVSAARGYGVSGGPAVFWTVCAVVGGPVFGLAGWAWWRRPGRAGSLGAAFLPGTFLGEAIGSYVLRLHYYTAGVLFSVIGIAALVLLGWRVRRPDILLWTAVIGVAGIVLYGFALDLLLGAAPG